MIEDLRPILVGWVSYFRKSEVRITFEELDQWIRRKLRAILWRQWKRPWTRARELMRRGLDHCSRVDFGHQRPRPLVECWRKPHEPRRVPTRFFSQLGLPSLLQESQRLAAFNLNRRIRNRTYGGVGGRGRQRPLLPDTERISSSPIR